MRMLRWMRGKNKKNRSKLNAFARTWGVAPIGVQMKSLKGQSKG